MENEKKERKLKGSLNKLQPKTVFVVFGIAGVLLLLLRIYQTVVLMDPATGFFKDNGNFTIMLFYVLSIGIVAAVFLLFYLGRQVPVSLLHIRRNVPHALACMLFAGTLIVDAVTRFSDYKAMSQAFVSADPKQAETKLLLAYLIFAVLGALVFALDAVVFFTGAAFGGKLRILRLIPVFWAFFLTIRYFAVTASYIHSTQLFLTIFSVAFFMLFLFEYARKIAGIVPEENTAVFCATGLVSAILLLTVGVTNLILVVTGKGCMPHCEFVPYSLSGGLFCITSLFLLKGASARDASASIPTAPLSVDEAPVRTEEN